MRHHRATNGGNIVNSHFGGYSIYWNHFSLCYVVLLLCCVVVGSNGGGLRIVYSPRATCPLRRTRRHGPRSIKRKRDEGVCIPTIYIPWGAPHGSPRRAEVRRGRGALVIDHTVDHQTPLLREERRAENLDSHLLPVVHTVVCVGDSASQHSVRFAEATLP